MKIKTTSLLITKPDFRKLFSVCIFLLTVIPSIHGQTFHKGYVYHLGYDDYYPFKYTREYQEEENIYTTIYKLYHPQKGSHNYTITAVHDKLKKNVKVDIEKIGGGIFFSEIREEETSYEVASMKPFGFRGNIGVLGGNKVPNQLMVKFVSNKYENVKIVHVFGTPKVTPDDWYFYILDEKN